jgi:hypothetical protein
MYEEPAPNVPNLPRVKIIKYMRLVFVTGRPARASSPLLGNALGIASRRVIGVRARLTWAFAYALIAAGTAAPAAAETAPCRPLLATTIAGRVTLTGTTSCGLTFHHLRDQVSRSTLLAPQWRVAILALFLALEVPAPSLALAPILELRPRCRD